MTSPKLRFKEFREEWKLYKLKDKACFLAGYAFDSNKMDSKEGKYQLLKMSNVYQNQLDLTRNPSYWNDIDKGYERWLLERGDIVLTLTGTVGKKDYGYSIEVPESNKFLLNQRLVRLRQIDGESLSKFIKYRISTDRFFYHFFNISKGGTGNQSNVSIEDLKLIEVNFPSIDEQIKIANFLTAVDEKISQLNEQHQLMIQYKKGVMQKIFSQEIRFKDDDGEEFGEWEERILEDVSIIIMGSSPKSENYNELGIGLPLLQGNADIKNRKSCPRNFTTEITKECYVGDILMSVRAPVGYVAKAMHDACIGRGIAAIRVKENNNQEFLYQYLIYMEDIWGRFSQGSTFDSVNSEQIKKLSLFIPCLQEQTKIADFLTKLDDKIEKLALQLEQVKTWKKGLLQQMFV